MSFFNLLVYKFIHFLFLSSLFLIFIELIFFDLLIIREIHLICYFQFSILEYGLFHLIINDLFTILIKMKNFLNLHMPKDSLHKHNGQDKILLSCELRISRIQQNKYQKNFLSILFNKIHLNQTEKVHHFNFVIYQN